MCMTCDALGYDSGNCIFATSSYQDAIGNGEILGGRAAHLVSGHSHGNPAAGERWGEFVSDTPNSVHTLNQTSGTGFMTVDSSYDGSIGFLGDSDWIRVQFTQGETYRITMYSAYAETFVALADNVGTVLVNDNFEVVNHHGVNYAVAELEVTATRTGDYFIIAEESGNNGVGGYTVEVNTVTGGTNPGGLQPWTMEQVAHRLTDSGWAFFNGTRRSWDENTITYDVSQISAAGQVLAGHAFDAWTKLTGLTFTSVNGGGNQANAMITFQNTESGAFANSNPLKANGQMQTARINIATDWETQYGTTLDSHLFQTYIHEIGHVLGLAHAGDYNAGNGQVVSYPNSALFENDSLNVTIMSYITQSMNTNDNADFAQVMTPMLADIYAIQDLYGVPTQAYHGNTTYGKNSNTGDYMDIIFDALVNGNTSSSLIKGGVPLSFTLWDTGGTDSIDFSTDTQAQNVSLEAEKLSDIYGVKGAMVIGRNTVIENYFAGSNSDTIKGNAAANRLEGRGGDDSLFGGTGSDKIYGGSGNDYVRVGGGVESFYGGSGTDDYISYYDSSGGIHINLAENTITGSWANNDVVSGFESVGGSSSGGDTMYGTSGANRLKGYGGDDKFYAGSGNDKVYGGSGNDYVRAGGGVESFYGGSGSDDYISYADSTGGIHINLAANTITGSWANNDVVSGFESVGGSSSGGDTMYGTSGANRLKGYGGDDKFYAGSGNDKVYGGSGNDYVRAGGGVESFYGGSGSDDYISYADSTGGIHINLAANTITGSWANNDVVSGFESVGGSSSGGDTMYGTSGANRLKGYGGDDKFYAGSGNDKVYGGSGNDYVRAGGGVESFYGGSGSDDYISYADSTGGIHINLAENTITGSWANNDVVSGFESVGGSSTGGDTMYGTDGANRLKGYGGDDKFYAGSGNDEVFGGSGDDYVKAGGGVESFYGGSGSDDYISYADSSGGIHIDLAANTITGSWANNDVISGFESAGGSSNGGDRMYGTSGANRLKSYGGDDSLYGRSGDDKLYGGSGKDRFDGGNGSDTLWGGSGDDIFHFDKGEDADIIKDFENNDDTIEFDNFGYLSDAASALAFATESGGDVLFNFGADGSLLVENATKSQLLNDIDIV